MDKLSSTQIDAIAENHVANMPMITIDGRYRRFNPLRTMMVSACGTARQAQGLGEHGLRDWRRAEQ
jgi:hypothetical protein